MKIIFIGGGGFTDAGGWYIGEDGRVHFFEGWAAGEMAELGHLLGVLREASQLKTPELAEAAIQSVLDMTHKELGQHTRGGAVVVIA